MFDLASCVSHTCILPHTCRHKEMQYFANQSSGTEHCPCLLGSNFVIKKEIAGHRFVSGSEHIQCADGFRSYVL